MSIVLNNLNFSWGNQQVLREVSFQVEHGELVGLIGPNGAGKSTLLKLLAGVLPITAGEVNLDDLALTQMDRREVARKLAYLAQDRQVEWDLSVRNLVALGRFPHGDMTTPDTAALIDETLDSVDAYHLIDRTIHTLSGGERARVLLARALVVKAPFLMVDEPVAELDPYHQLQVMDILRETANAGNGVLTVLHDITLASRYMDRVILLNQGVVVASGPPAEVMTEDRLREVYDIEVQTVSFDGQHYPVPWNRSR